MRRVFCCEGASGITRSPFAGWSFGLPVLPGSLVSGLGADDLVAGQGPAIVLRIEDGSLADARRLGRACRRVRGSQTKPTTRTLSA